MPCDNITGKTERKFCVGDVPCCLYCEFISKCYKQWKKGIFHCRIEKNARYCSDAQIKLDREGGLPWRIA